MSWQTELIVLLRHLIGDVDSSAYIYTDSRLQQTIVVAAQYVFSEIDFDQSYSVNIGTLCITPDPTDAPRDDDAIALITLKAACLLDMQALRSGSQRVGVRVKIGPSELEVKDAALKAQTEILERGACAAYEQFKMDYLLNRGSPGAAIFSTVTGPNIQTSNRCPTSDDVFS